MSTTFPDLWRYKTRSRLNFLNLKVFLSTNYLNIQIYPSLGPWRDRLIQDSNTYKSDLLQIYHLQIYKVFMQFTDVFPFRRSCFASMTSQYALNFQNPKADITIVFLAEKYWPRLIFNPRNCFIGIYLRFRIFILLLILSFCTLTQNPPEVFYAPL